MDRIASLEDTDQSAEFEEPQGEVERVIAEVWGETLKVDRVGRNDNFFALGGNSLVGMELAEKISARLDVNIAPVVLFLNPTPCELALFLLADTTE
jgi:hypothetical protein